jgi:hypothetical protein
MVAAGASRLCCCKFLRRGPEFPGAAPRHLTNYLFARRRTARHVVLKSDEESLKAHRGTEVDGKK